MSDTLDREGTAWRWKIEPHPYDKQYDSYITNSDLKALEVIKDMAEGYMWEKIKTGETRTMKVTFNKNVKEVGGE